MWSSMLRLFLGVGLLCSAESGHANVQQHSIAREDVTNYGAVRITDVPKPELPFDAPASIGESRNKHAKHAALSVDSGGQIIDATLAKSERPLDAIEATGMIRKYGTKKKLMAVDSHGEAVAVTDLKPVAAMIERRTQTRPGYSKDEDSAALLKPAKSIVEDRGETQIETGSSGAGNRDEMVRKAHEQIAELTRELKVANGKLHAAEEKTNAVVEKADATERVQSSAAEKARKTTEGKSGRSASLHRKKNADLFEGCRTKIKKSNEAQKETNKSLRELTSARGEVKRATCGDDEVELFKANSAEIEVTCCPIAVLDCAGCAHYDGSHCSSCMGGYTLTTLAPSETETCVACVDTAGWVDDEGKTCPQLSESNSCSDITYNGVSSNTACCHCGGGHLSPTPFKYEHAQAVIGGSLEVFPSPRTAERYSLNQDCELAKYDLSMDGTTGRVYGTPNTMEPLSLECEVTAHQDVNLTTVAELKITIGYVAYSSPVLLFDSGFSYSPLEVAPTAAPTAAPTTSEATVGVVASFYQESSTSTSSKNYSMHCAPTVSWLQLDSSTGRLDINDEDIESGGAVTSVDDELFHQDGGICSITLTVDNSTYDTMVVVVRPKRVPFMSFSTSQISVTVGENTPVVKLTYDSSAQETAVVKPSWFLAACDVQGISGATFVYDTQLRAGLLNGHFVFEIQDDGSILAAPAPTFSTVFDSLDSSGTSRKAIDLHCQVYGLFYVSWMSPLQTEVAITIEDNVCWVTQQIIGNSISVDRSSESGCRMACRESNSCSHFLFESANCAHYYLDASGTRVMAHAKITDCTDLTACVKLVTPYWYLNGAYCPIGVDVLRGVVYHREGETNQTTFYLVEHSPDVDGQIDVSGTIYCDSADHTGYVLRLEDADVDFIDAEAGHFELRGNITACLNANIVQNAFDGQVDVIVDEPSPSPAPGEGYFLQNGDVVWLKSVRFQWLNCSTSECHAAGSCPDNESDRNLGTSSSCAGELFQIYNSANVGPIRHGDTVWLQHNQTTWLSCWGGGCEANSTCPDDTSERAIEDDTGCRSERFQIYGSNSAALFFQGDIVWLKSVANNWLSAGAVAMTNVHAGADCPASASERAITADTGCYGERFRIYGPWTGRQEAFVPYIALSTGTCPAPDVSSERSEGDNPVIVETLAIDDPTTPDEFDFWLHPCDCATPAWGRSSPINPTSYEAIPPESANVFIPPPFTIVIGQFTCDMASLISVQVEGEDEALDQSFCETQCKDDQACNFYWHGTQHEANACRLYSACKVLVREFGMSGNLVAVPRREMCHISDPEACWTTTLRRDFLTNLEPIKCASHSCSSGTTHKSSYADITCGFAHQVGGGCNDVKCCDTVPTYTKTCSEISGDLPGEVISSVSDATAASCMTDCLSTLACTCYAFDPSRSNTCYLLSSPCGESNEAHGESDDMTSGVCTEALACKDGSPDACTLEEITLLGFFSPGKLLKVTGGHDTYRSTDDNSCPEGWKIFSPRSQTDWETVISSTTLPLESPHFIVDVTKTTDNCDSCSNGAMNSRSAYQSAWTTADDSSWWLSDNPFNESSGNYEANCYLGISSFAAADDITLNDSACTYHSTSYFCQPSAPTCHGNYSSWDGGYGNCMKYAPGESNSDYCGVDFGSGLFANQTCPQCGHCSVNTIAATYGLVTAPFVFHAYGYAELPEGSGAYSGGILEFNVTCAGSATATFEAEVIAPDGGSDSFQLRLDDGDKQGWHTGTKSSWLWSDTSPSISLSAGSHTVKLVAREDGIMIRALRFASGMVEAGCLWQEADCGQVGHHPDPTCGNVLSGQTSKGCSNDQVDCTIFDKWECKFLCDAYSDCNSMILQTAGCQLCSSEVNDTFSGTYAVTFYSKSCLDRMAQSSTSAPTSPPTSPPTWPTPTPTSERFLDTWVTITGMRLNENNNIDLDTYTDLSITECQAHAIAQGFQCYDYDTSGQCRIPSADTDSDWCNSAYTSSFLGVPFTTGGSDNFNLTFQCSAQTVKRCSWSSVSSACDNNGTHCYAYTSASLAGKIARSAMVQKEFARGEASNEKLLGRSLWGDGRRRRQRRRRRTRRRRTLEPTPVPTTLSPTYASPAPTACSTHSDCSSGMLCESGYCVACDTSAYYEDSSGCHLKVCTCTYGIAPIGLQCPNHGDAFCLSCDVGQGYYLSSTSICSLKQCTCSNGTGATGTQCPNNGDEFCVSCSDGYALKLANQSICTKTTLTYTIPSFHYLHLHQQCDQVLLIGGVGVESCARPTYALPSSHTWQNKRPLPQQFEHGAVLSFSCWPERYRPANQLGNAVESEELHCVAGKWFDSNGYLDLTNFVCAPCLQMAPSGYSQHDAQKKQELVWHNKVRTIMFTDLYQQYCLQTNGNLVELQNQEFCKEFLLQDVPATTEESRQVLLVDDHQTCLTGVLASSLPILEAHACSKEVDQLITARQIPTMLWNMHGYLSADSVTLFAWTAGSTDITELSGEVVCDQTGAFSNVNLGAAGPTCNFAPVIQSEVEWQLASYGTPTDDDVSSVWRHKLAKAHVECQTGEALTALKPQSNGLEFQCSIIAGMGACIPWYSNQEDIDTDTDDTSGIGVLNDMSASCENPNLLASFHLEHSDSGGWVRWRFSCCRAGGVPTVMEPVGLDVSLYEDYEGIYCPVGKDISGRFRYERVQSPLGSDVAQKSLQFVSELGCWCVDTLCVNTGHSSEPFGLVGPSFEITVVSDFDGVFEGKGVPKEEGESITGAESHLLNQLVPPMPPSLPQIPTLETFEPVKPEYAQECRFDQFAFPSDDGPLWHNVQDSIEETKLEYTQQYEDGELPVNHPCKISANVKGVFDKKYGNAAYVDGHWRMNTDDTDKLGDDEEHGGADDDPLGYEGIFSCFSRFAARNNHGPNIDFAHGMLADIWKLYLASGKLGCSVVPGLIFAPLGLGYSKALSSPCMKTLELKKTIPDLMNNLWQRSMKLDIARRNGMDCNPFVANFARLFCDLHCVRDAVIRGDLTINRNLKSATDITNRNMEQLAKWNVDTLNLQTNYLAEKMEYIDTKLDIMQAAQPTVEEIVAGITNGMSLMSKEMKDFAQASNFDVVSRTTARHILEEFVHSADQVGVAPNITRALAVFDKLKTLHAGLKAVGRRKPASRMDVLLQKGLTHMEEPMRLQMRTLGIYREHSSQSQRMVRAWRRDRSLRVRSSSAAVLVDIDKLWWRLRKMLDECNEKADEQVTSFQSAYKAMADFRGCSLGFSALTEKYNHAMSVTEKANAFLHNTWRESNNLLGELASTIVDGEAFNTFHAEQGCNSTLANATLHQVGIAAGGMHMLLSRYDASGLISPDIEPLIDALQRIHTSYEQSLRECETEYESNIADASGETVDAETVARMFKFVQFGEKMGMQRYTKPVQEKLASWGLHIDARSD